MEIETAPSTDNEDEECGICEAEGSFVLYDGDKVCKECGHAPAGGSGRDSLSDGGGDTEWADWLQHRRDEYDGFYGEDRIKFVGGFASAYEFGSDFE
jgi:hypothetical protein